MRYLIALLLALSVTAGEAAAQPATVTVVKVVDGDTVDVRFDDGSLERLRLIGMDTPEVVDPRKPVQCYGREASGHAHELLDGQAVSIETDPSQGDRDKYGRLLAYLYLPDGTSFAQAMIADGYAHEYTYRLPYAYQADFRAAQQAAIENGLGLWAPETCNGQTGITSAEALAQAYISALYAGDDARASELYLFHDPRSRHDEQLVTLVQLKSRAISRQDAGDTDPVSAWTWVLVETQVISGDRLGYGTYVVGVMPMPQVDGALRVNAILGGISWSVPAPAEIAAYGGPFDPRGPDRDCKDFASQADAQAFFAAAQRLTGQRDHHRLDADGNGIACESLP